MLSWALFAVFFLCAVWIGSRALLETVFWVQDERRRRRRERP
jgi:hypothetical protein